MKTITFKIEDAILKETEQILYQLKKPRNQYINEAIEFYNRTHKRQLLEQKYKKESEIVSSNSMSLLKEFDECNDSLP